MKTLTKTLLLFLLPVGLFAQNNNVDSLKKVLSHAKTSKIKIETLTRLADYYYTVADS